jgi:hypothetical protein
MTWSSRPDAIMLYLTTFLTAQHETMKIKASANVGSCGEIKFHLNITAIRVLRSEDV